MNKQTATLTAGGDVHWQHLGETIRFKEMFMPSSQ